MKILVPVKRVVDCNVKVRVKSCGNAAVETISAAAGLSKSAFVSRELAKSYQSKAVLHLMGTHRQASLVAQR